MSDDSEEEVAPATNPNCSDFAQVVKKYIENHNRTKACREEMKALKAEQDELQASIIAYMETKDLDVCKINNGSECGELATTTKRSRSTLKREQQVAQIASFFDVNNIEFQSGTTSTKADELYDTMQKSREQTSKKGLVLRKSR